MTAIRSGLQYAALVLLSLPILGMPALPASAAETPAPVVVREYHFHYVEERELNSFLNAFCEALGNFQCRVSQAKGYVTLTTTADGHAQFEAWLKGRDVPPRTQVFHVHLFSADNGAATAEPIPEALQPVLKDLAGFLPFRSFRLVSTGLVRTSSVGRIDLGGDPEFMVDLRFAGDPAEGKPLQIEQFELSRRQMVAGEGGSMQVGSFDVLRTSFSMRVGETVVVGTSKLDGGDKALVVLLTAVK